MAHIKTRFVTAMTEGVFKISDPVTVYYLDTKSVIYDKEGDAIRTNDMYVFVQGDVVIFNMWLVEDLLFGGKTTSKHMYVTTSHDKFVDDVTDMFKKVTCDVIECDEMNNSVEKFFTAMVDGIRNMSYKRYN